MSHDAANLLPPRIAVLDDERQIHASIRLRIGKQCELVSFYDPRVALKAVGEDKFDLCIVDIHMPHLDGLSFVERAKERDPALGFVILSAFDTDENLRRTIPLQVYEFIPKPLPERDGFEAKLGGWVTRTRQSRRDLLLAHQAETIDRELQDARLNREVELVASESARDALRQSANLLTTIHAHLVTAKSLATTRAKTDPSILHLLRNLELALITAEAAVTVAEGFFDSAYAHRDSSPALVGAGLQHAIGIAVRMCHADEAGKVVDFPVVEEGLPIRGLSGIDFLLTTFPAIALALSVAAENSTVRLHLERLERLESAMRDPRFKHFLWVNRRHAINSQPAVLISVSTAAPALTRSQAEGWLNGEPGAFSTISPLRLLGGVEKAQGLLGLAVAPSADRFHLILVLPI